MALVRTVGESVLDPVLSVVDRVCLVSVWVGGILMIVASALIGIEVVIRKFFTLSIGGVDEIGSYVLSVSAAWAFGFALLRRAHVRIDSLYVLFPVRIRVLMDLFGVVLFMVFFGLVAWYAFDVVADSIRVGTRSWTKLQTPLAIPQTVWFVGLVVTVLVAFLLILRSLARVVTGPIEAVQPLIGSRSIDEELKEEIDAIEEDRAEFEAKETPR